MGGGIAQPNVPVKLKHKHPPPGHLTVHCAREGGNLNVPWKGGEFEPD